MQASDLIIERFRDRDAWLEARRAHDVIGASEAAMALGVSPYGTPWALWERKQQQPSDEKRGDQLQRGHRWEPAVLAEYEDVSGNKLVPIEKLFGAPMVTLSHPSAPWLRETPDGFAIDQAGEIGQVEAKTALVANVWAPDQGTIIESWDDAWAELLPAHYAIQGYVQLSVTQLPWVDLTALVPGGMWLKLRYVRLMRDVDTQTALVEALAEWREKHLIKGEPPAIDGSDPCNRYLAAKFPTPEKRPQRVATESERALILELSEIKARAKKDAAREEVIKNQLIEAAAGHRLTLGTNKEAPFGQAQRAGGQTYVDYKALAAESPEIAKLIEKHYRKGAVSQFFQIYRF